MVREDTAQSKDRIPAFLNLGRINHRWTEPSDIINGVSENMQLPFNKNPVRVNYAPDIQKVIDENFEIGL
jgi:hypothetical protein